MPKLAYFTPRTEGLRPVRWVGPSLEDLRRFPEPVQDAIGYALFLAQRGDAHPTAKRLTGELRGLVQVADDFGGSTYRAVYSTRRDEAVFVLHVFQKKSTRGIATPRHVIELIKRRHREALAGSSNTKR